MADNKSFNGIVVFDEPMGVCFLDFAFDHLGCDAIAIKDSIFDPDDTKIVAYASAEEYNPALWDIFRETYGKDEYALMKHMSEAEAYSID